MAVGLGARARKRAVITTALAALLIGSAPTSIVRAQTAPDPSDVVIVLDSMSMDMMVSEVGK